MFVRDEPNAVAEKCMAVGWPDNDTLLLLVADAALYGEGMMTPTVRNVAPPVDARAVLHCMIHGLSHPFVVVHFPGCQTGHPAFHPHSYSQGPFWLPLQLTAHRLL